MLHKSVDNNPLVYYGLICLVSSSSFCNINILIGWKLWRCVVIGKKYVKFLAYPTQISCLEFLWHMHIVHIAINKVSRNLQQVSPLQSSFVPQCLLLGIFVHKVFETNLNFRYQQVRIPKKYIPQVLNFQNWHNKSAFPFSDFLLFRT